MYDARRRIRAAIARAAGALLLLAAGTSPAQTVMEGWKDGTLDRFMPYAVYASSQISNAHQTIDNKYNMIATGQGTGILYNYDLKWPETSGAVVLNLSRVKIAFQDRSTPFRILVSASGNQSGDFEEVYSGTSSATLDRTHFQGFDFTSRPARYVKIQTRVTNGYLNLAEVQFFGSFGSRKALHHPGILLSQADIDDTYDRVRVGYEPQKRTFQRLTDPNDPEVARDFQPSALAALHITSTRDDVDTGHSEFVARDSEAAYKQALLWISTRDAQYAKNVIAILDAWGRTLKTVSGDNMPLESGWALTSYFKAAELVKHTYGGWDAAVERRFLDMVETVLLPEMEWYTSGNSNVWFTRLEARLYMAIFTDNRHQYDRLVHLFKGLLANPDYMKPTGQLVELTRDVGHANFALNTIVQVAETALHQGTNLYAYSVDGKTSTIYRMLEYHAGVYNGLVPDPLPSNKSGVVVWPLSKNSEGAGDFVGVVGNATTGHELGYVHYATRLGWPMPETRKRVAYNRQLGHMDWPSYGWGWATLTHGDRMDDEPVAMNGSAPLVPPAQTATVAATPAPVTPASPSPVDATTDDATATRATPRRNARGSVLRALFQHVR